MPDERCEAVLRFWFETPRDDSDYFRERGRLWFVKSDETDRAIGNRFGATLAAAAAGELDHWAETPRGRTALIVVLDQFPRNIHRGRPEAFAQDEKALSLALQGLTLRHDRGLPLPLRLFFYLPLEHAENLAMQERCVALVKKARDTATGDARDAAEEYLRYAERHRDVILRFGRFPHRNEILGRESTAEEAAFLQQPGSRF